MRYIRDKDQDRTNLNLIRNQRQRMFSLDALTSPFQTSNPLAVTLVDGLSDDDSDNASQNSDDRLQGRAAEYETRLQGALQLDERTSSLVSLEPIPRQGAEELGRKVKSEWDEGSLIGGGEGNGEGGDDRSVVTLESLLSEAKKNREPTFIKVPTGGDPTIITQKSWDNIMAHEVGDLVPPQMEEKAEAWETLAEQKEEKDEKEDDKIDSPRVDVDVGEDVPDEIGGIEFSLSDFSNGVVSNQENVEPTSATATPEKEGKPRELEAPEPEQSSRGGGKVPKRKWRLFPGRKGSKKDDESKNDESIQQEENKHDVADNIVIKVVETEMVQDGENGGAKARSQSNGDEDAEVPQDLNGLSPQSVVNPYYEAVDEDKDNKKCGSDICGQTLSFG